jgi:uncharacterized flavoprotein (TIGR03862 family)
MANVVIIGAGPAGLFAAERLVQAGHRVTVHDRMPSPARKFQLAGRGGLNLTHSEPLDAFLGRYGESRHLLEPMIRRFAPADLRAWCHALGEETFIGSSGRVFPKSFKASPLLRAWLRRLGAAGVTLVSGSRWMGWKADGKLSFSREEMESNEAADAVVLAMGGASWPRMGSDGGWVPLLAQRGIEVTPLWPANCGLEMTWSQIFRDRFAGAPLKRITLSFGARSVRGEAVITAEGLEGGAVYALGAQLRTAVQAGGASVTIDLRPDLSLPQLAELLRLGRKGDSLSNKLRKQAGLSPQAASLLREVRADVAQLMALDLARLIKSLPLDVTGFRPVDRAISTAGGVSWRALDEGLMLRAFPGVFCAGEMIDWEAPTGGYLLQACFATGAAAAAGVSRWLQQPTPL